MKRILIAAASLLTILAAQNYEESKGPEYCFDDKCLYAQMGHNLYKMSKLNQCRNLITKEGEK